MIYLKLAVEFLKIGLFAFGGGYATIPFLYSIANSYNWYSVEELKQMIAVAAITPGPVGINVATYAGLRTAGIVGSIIATVSEMLPSLILVLIVSKILKKYSENFYVKSIMEILKPIGCALLISVGLGMLKFYIFDYKAIILLVFLLLLSWKSKKDPIFYMAISGIVGIAVIFLTNFNCFQL